MRTLVRVSGGGLDPFAASPSGQSAPAFESDIASTLTRCRSGAGWVLAARTATRRTASGQPALQILENDCGFRFTDEPQVIPLDAPGCPPVRGARVAATLGPCPTTYPRTPLTKLNAGVSGLDRNLVPIKATIVRVCDYDGSFALTRRAMLSGYIARVYSHAANGLRTVSPAGAPAILCLGSPAPPLWFVTFANDTQQVSITVPECGYSTNGFLDGPGGFLNDLQPLTTAAPVAVTKSEGGVDGLR